MSDYRLSIEVTETQIWVVSEWWDETIGRFRHVWVQAFPSWRALLDWLATYEFATFDLRVVRSV